MYYIKNLFGNIKFIQVLYILNAYLYIFDLKCKTSKNEAKNKIIFFNY